MTDQKRRDDKIASLAGPRVTTEPFSQRIMGVLFRALGPFVLGLLISSIFPGLGMYGQGPASGNAPLVIVDGEYPLTVDHFYSYSRNGHIILR